MKGKRLENLNECQLCQVAIKALIEGSGKANLNKLHGITNEAINGIMYIIKWHISMCNLWDDNVDIDYIRNKNLELNNKYEKPYSLGNKTIETRIEPYIIGCTKPDDICCILVNENCSICPLNEIDYEKKNN